MRNLTALLAGRFPPEEAAAIAAAVQAVARDEIILALSGGIMDVQERQRRPRGG